MTPGELGAIIMAERKRQQLTRLQLAAKAKVGIRFLSEVESGKEGAQLGKVLYVLAALDLEPTFQRV